MSTGIRKALARGRVPLDAASSSSPRERAVGACERQASRSVTIGERRRTPRWKTDGRRDKSLAVHHAPFSGTGPEVSAMRAGASGSAPVTSVSAAGRGR
jgi:hypothetical protein